MKSGRLKTILIVLSSVALALVVLTAFVVFYPSGSYAPVVVQHENEGATFSNLPSSTPSSTLFIPSSTAPSSTTTTPTGAELAAAAKFSSDYSAPYPVAWKEGNEQFSLIGAALQGDELTLTLAIQMGTVSECVPVAVRLVTDESGTLAPPVSPASSTFIFPDTQSCDGTPGATYSEPLTFTVDNVPTPFLVTTGGTSNVFFMVATDTNGGVDATLPGTSG